MGRRKMTDYEKEMARIKRMEQAKLDAAREVRKNEIIDVVDSILKDRVKQILRELTEDQSENY